MSETQTFDAATYTALGTARDRVSLPATPFDGTVNMPVMHQAVKGFLANQRQGTAATKTRGLVAGGNQKPWKQKGTGRARQGSIRAPQWPGGGTVFGPHGDRNYNETIPRQVRALARKSALNARARTNDVLVVDRFSYEKPKTAVLRAALERIGVSHKKVLILTDGSKPAVYLSARNLPNVHTLPYADASTYHILWSDVVVIEALALGAELAPVSEKHAAHKPHRKHKTHDGSPDASKAREKAVKAKTVAKEKKKAVVKKKAAAKAHAAKKKPAAKKTAKKSAAKKPAARKPAATKKKKGK